MQEINGILEVIPEERMKKLNMLAEIEGTTPANLINEVTITFFSQIMKPNFEQYQSVYLENGKKISGLMARMEEKGKKAWEDGTHGMPNHVKKIIEGFGDELVSRELLEYSYRLMDTTLTNIFESGNDAKQKKYREALMQPNFIYMMLQISLRLLAFDLYDRKIKTENTTLHYMTKMLIDKKKEIKKIFEQAYTSEERDIAITRYYELLQDNFNDFTKQVAPLSDGIKVGEEKKLVSQIGEDVIFTFLGFLIEKIRIKYTTQLALWNSEAINIK